MNDVTEFISNKMAQDSQQNTVMYAKKDWINFAQPMGGIPILVRLAETLTRDWTEHKPVTINGDTNNHIAVHFKI